MNELCARKKHFPMAAATFSQTFVGKLLKKHKIIQTSVVKINFLAHRDGRESASSTT
jgi:hypothetical protein